MPGDFRTDRDLLPVAVLLWIGSFARVFPAISRREAFETEATLALVCLLLIPCLIFVARRRSKGDDR